METANLGLCYYNKDEINLATDNFQKAAELNPKDIYALFYLGYIYQNNGLTNFAIENYNKVLELSPDYSWAYFNLASIAYKNNNLEEAKRYLVRAVEQNPDIETQNTLAMTYFQLGDYEQALSIFKNLDIKRPKNISVLMEIARCYEALNNNDLALEYLDKVVSIFPDYEEAHEMIRKLS